MISLINSEKILNKIFCMLKIFPNWNNIYLKRDIWPEKLFYGENLEIFLGISKHKNPIFLKIYFILMESQIHRE